MMAENKPKVKRIVYAAPVEDFEDLEEIAKAGGVSKVQAMRDSIKYLLETIRKCNEEGYVPIYQKRDNPSQKIEIWLLPYISSRKRKKSV
jgi:hypothetical protein